MTVHQIWPSLNIGKVVVDFYPDEAGPGVSVCIWQNDERNAGYSVDCKDRQHLNAVLRTLEAEFR